MEELCQDLTLNNLVIMIHQWGEVSHDAEARLQSDLSDPYGFIQAVERRGAKIYRCIDASVPDLGALRIILGSWSAALDKEVRELRRELEEQKRRAQQEADALKKRIAEMRLEEIIRKETCQELDEQKRKAREEADGLKKRCAEMQSKLKEDRHGSGKASAAYNFRHVPAHLRVFLLG